MRDQSDFIDHLYIDLYEAERKSKGISRRQIAEQCSISHTCVNNFLKKAKRSNYKTLVKIGNAIEIKRLEAFIAVEVLRDIDSYNHPGMTLLASLLKPLGECLAGRSSPITDDFRENDMKAFADRLVRATHDTVMSRERALSQFRQSSIAKSD